MVENEYNEYVSWMDGNVTGDKLTNVFCEDVKIKKRSLIYLKKINTQFRAVQREHYKAAMFREPETEDSCVELNNPKTRALFFYFINAYVFVSKIYFFSDRAKEARFL